MVGFAFMGISLSLTAVWLVNKSLRGEFMSEPERLLLRVIFWPGLAPLVPLVRMGISMKIGISMLIVINAVLWAGIGAIVDRIVDLIRRRRSDPLPNQALRAIGDKSPQLGP